MVFGYCWGRWSWSPLTSIYLTFWCSIRLENHSPHGRKVHSATCFSNKLTQCLFSLPARWMPPTPSNPTSQAWLCVQSCPPAVWTTPRHEKWSPYYPKELRGLSAIATSLSQCDLSKHGLNHDNTKSQIFKVGHEIVSQWLPLTHRKMQSCSYLVYLHVNHDRGVCLKHWAE